MLSRHIGEIIIININMIRLLTDKTVYTLIIDGVTAIDEYVELKDDYVHTLLLLPYSDALPVNGYIRNKEGSIDCSIPFIIGGDGTVTLLPKFPNKAAIGEPTVLSQEELGTHLVTVYLTDAIYVMVENATSFIKLPLPSKPVSVRAMASDGQELIVVKCEGYTAIIEYTDDYRVVFSKYADIIEFTEDGIIAQKNYNDMLGRIGREHYRYEYNEYICDSAEYSYTHPHRYIAELIPCLFVESLIAKDYDYARKLLSPEYEDITSAHNFLGDIVAIRPAPRAQFHPEELELLVRTENGIQLKKVKFSLIAGIITDIDCE